MALNPLDFAEDSYEIFGPKFSWNANQSINMIVYAR
jgi:hypothetical protein